MVTLVLRAGAWPAGDRVSGAAVVVGGRGIALPAAATVLFPICFHAARCRRGDRPRGAASRVVDVTPTGPVGRTTIRAVASLAPLTAGALVTLAAAMRELALPWSAAGIALAGNVLFGLRRGVRGPDADRRTGRGDQHAVVVPDGAQPPAADGPPGQHVPGAWRQRAVVGSRVLDRPRRVHGRRRPVGQRSCPTSGSAGCRSRRTPCFLVRWRRHHHGTGPHLVTHLAAWCLRIAGASGIVNALGFGGFAIPAIVSVGQGHGIIYTFGNPTYGNGPFERIGVPTTVAAGGLPRGLRRPGGRRWPAAVAASLRDSGLGGGDTARRALLVGLQSSIRVAQRGRSADLLGPGMDGAEGILMWFERRWQIFRLGGNAPGKLRRARPG